VLGVGLKEAARYFLVFDARARVTDGVANVDCLGCYV
jgi:hypothetical protein